FKQRIRKMRSDTIRANNILYRVIVQFTIFDVLIFLILFDFFGMEYPDGFASLMWIFIFVSTYFFFLINLKKLLFSKYDLLILSSGFLVILGFLISIVIYGNDLSIVVSSLSLFLFRSLTAVVLG